MPDKMVEFELAVREVIKYLNKYHHPHTTVIITNTNAEVLEGTQSYSTPEFLRD